MSDLVRKLDREFIVQSVLAQMDRGLDWEGHYAMAMREADISRAEILQRVEDRAVALLALPVFLYVLGITVTRFNVYFCAAMAVTAAMYCVLLAIVRQLKIPLVTGLVVAMSLPFLVVFLVVMCISFSILLPEAVLSLYGLLPMFGPAFLCAVTSIVVMATYKMLKRPKRPLSISTIHPRTSEQEI